MKSPFWLGHFPTFRKSIHSHWGTTGWVFPCFSWGNWAKQPFTMDDDGMFSSFAPSHCSWLFLDPHMITTCKNTSQISPAPTRPKTQHISPCSVPPCRATHISVSLSFPPYASISLVSSSWRHNTPGIFIHIWVTQFLCLPCTCFW